MTKLAGGYWPPSMDTITVKNLREVLDHLEDADIISFGHFNVFRHSAKSLVAFYDVDDKKLQLVEEMEDDDD